jgi:hypothetical protein
MYIRRKVFSIAYDENGEEKLFSTTEIMSEESYLEKLYSENEEQKEFAVKPKISREHFKKLGRNWKSLEPLSEEKLVKAGRKLSEKEQLPRGLNASINIKKAGDVERNKKVIKATKEYPHLRFTKDAYLP